MAPEIRVQRLRRAVGELLAAARRGECTPDQQELMALHLICSDAGALDSSRAIREYLLDTIQEDAQREMAVRR